MKNGIGSLLSPALNLAPNDYTKSHVSPVYSVSVTIPNASPSGMYSDTTDIRQLDLAFLQSHGLHSRHGLHLFRHIMRNRESWRGI